jgi:hypothetical protein
MTDAVKIYPPWNVITVNNLNAYQWRSGMHPFTCENDSSHVLVATSAGWICPTGFCGYNQRWAHAFMADPTTWPNITMTVSGVPPQQLYEAIQQGVHRLPASDYCTGDDATCRLHGNPHADFSVDDDNEETMG